MKLRLTAACALPTACALLFAQPVLAETIERTLEASPKGEVEIVNVAGDVRVVGWDRAQVHMEAVLGDGIDKIEFERDGDLVRIEAKFPRDGDHGGSSALVVRVPQNSALMIKTVSASQSVENVRGEQRLQSVSGSIHSQIWSEDFDVKSVSGEIIGKGQGQDASIRATSVSGRIVLDNFGGEMDMSTVNGAMEIRAKAVSRARLKTTNGGVHLESSLTEDARIEAESINGAVNFQLRGKREGEFDIETFNGDIDNCFGPKPQRTSEFGPGNALRFKEGDSAARVRIKTLNGAVDLCHKP